MLTQLNSFKHLIMDKKFLLIFIRTLECECTCDVCIVCDMCPPECECVCDVCIVCVICALLNVSVRVMCVLCVICALLNVIECTCDVCIVCDMCPLAFSSRYTVQLD